MRAIQIHDEQGRPVTDPKLLAAHHAHDHHHCMSPFFGAYVAAGIVAVVLLAAWLLS